MRRATTAADTNRWVWWFPAAQTLAGSRARRLATTAALALVTGGCLATFAPMLGMPIGAATLVVLAAGALAVELLARTWALEATALVGLLALATTNKVYAAFQLVLVACLYLARRTSFGFAGVLAALTIVVPKHLFQAHYHQPGFYNWINEASLAMVLFAAACWWRDRRDGRLPHAGERASLPAWAAQFFFPGYAVNPMVLGTGQIFQPRAIDARGVLSALALVTAKALAHSLLWRLFPGWGFAQLDGARAAAAPAATLWGIVLVNYLDLVLTLSGTADIAILLARLYGWQLRSPFDWALLAWSPVELWRRWGIYNRRLLLRLVYFPLGGGQRRRELNVLLTFLASALLLHSGWFGSKYWTVGLGGWRDESVYFLLQGLAVCGCLLYGRLRHGAAAAAPPPDHTLRWSWGRAAATVATQAMSALIHVVILAQAIPFGERFRLMARCLGL